MKLPSTAIFREGVKGKQRPFGLQHCASHGRTFTWHFRCGVVDGENEPHSPQCLFVTSETYVTDLARTSRLKQADEIQPDRHAFLRKHTYFHSSDILLDLKVMLRTRLSYLSRFSTFLYKQKLPFWAL